MEREINLMEPELPQLSQMVQKNTERIVRSEKIINRLIMENDEQSRKSRERDEWWENSRREHERDMRDIRETMRQAAQMQAENQKGFQELKERFAETDKRMEEERRKTDAQIRAMFAETDKRMEEERRKTDAQIKAMFAETDKRSEEEWRELRERFAETDKRMEEERRKTDAQISNISRAFLGSTGHIVEGLMSSSIDKIFKDAGFNLYNRGKNIIRGFADGKKQMEVDAMLGNDEIVIPIEVKADFTEKKVKRFVHRMTMFREFFPECADKEIVAAVAAINYENGADTLARKEGLLVIRVSSDDIFSLDPFDIERLRRF